MAIAILIFIILEVISALIMWGVGNFIIWAFGITFAFTFWKALAVSIILTILANTFKTVIRK